MSAHGLGLLCIGITLIWGIWITASESWSPDGNSKRLAGQPRVKRVLIQNPHFQRPSFWVATFVLIFLLLGILGSGQVGVLFLPLVALLAGFIFMEQKRKKQIRRDFTEEIDQQFPQLIQIMAVLISSGMSPIRAIEVISLNSQSRLGAEFARIVASVHSGDSMGEALDLFARSIDTPLTRRFSSSLILAIERGSPLVEVLIEQARDARNEAKNLIQRRAGKSEIALMIPVVFLVLPISVLFALWPSLTQLGTFLQL